MAWRHIMAFAGGFAALVSSAQGQEFRIEEMGPATVFDVSRLRAKSIAFTDHRSDELADPGSGLIRFEDWARVRPVQKQLLSLYPSYVEPTINVTANGLTKPYKEKLHVYVAEARFLIDKPAAAIDLARYARLEFLEKIDPSIKHRLIAADEIAPLRDPESAHNLNPQRRWCEEAQSLCIESRYQLEGKLPVGIRLVNKLEDSGKKHAEYIEFQSELRLVPPQERPALAQITGLDAPVVGALEQNIFYVNQAMQFGKFLAVLQNHPADERKTVASLFMTLAVETDVLDRKKEFEKVPVLRNLVPAQVLMGNSSFNTGTSISAGLPDYARNRIKAVASILERG